MANFLQSASQLAQNLFAKFQQQAGSAAQGITHAIAQPQQAPLRFKTNGLVSQTAQRIANAPIPTASVPFVGPALAGIQHFQNPAVRVPIFTPAQIASNVVQTAQQIPRSFVEAKQTPFLKNILPGAPLPSTPITPKGNVEQALLGKQPLQSFTDTSRPAGQFLKGVGLSKQAVQIGTPILAGVGAIANDLPGGTGEKTVAKDVVDKVTAAFTHNLGAISGDVTRVFKPQEVATAIEQLKGKPLTGDVYKDNAIKLANFLDANKKGLIQNLPTGAGLSVGDIRKGETVNQAQQAKTAIPKNTQSYLDELAGKQKAAGSSGPATLLQKGKNTLSDLKAKIIDTASPIEDAVNMIEKKAGQNIKPTSDVRLQIDRVLRSKSLASQFAEDHGLTNAIKQAPDLHALDQYMIAKQASRVGELGIQTGRDTSRDAQLVKDLGPQYEPLAKQVNQYSQKLLDYSVHSGLINPDLATKLKAKYPDYVPLNRIFNELEQNGYQGATKSIANLSKQTVVQKLVGSNREIQSPIQSLLLKTQTAFQQGEKNIAARQLASYRDLPGLKNLITPIKSTSESPHTFSYLDNGVKKVFATTPEIASAAKNLNGQQMDVVTKVLSYPTRALQLGATSLNIPFTATNLLKDQIDTFINSNPKYTASIMNPVNFVHALIAATTHNELYKEANRNAAISTSFDIARDAPDLAINKIRAGNSVGSQIAYTARHPGELLRDLENLIGRTEELTRIQNYRGQYQALIKEGKTPEDARLLAAQAARTNTANFARHGDIGKIINYVIPFFNASIQGSRTFINAAKNNPAQTGAKLAVGLFLPMAATTLYSLSDPQRKAVYDDISQSDKEKNIIIIPDGSTKDANGKYNVIKIPIPTGLAPLVNLVRRGVEQAQGGNPVAAKEVFDGLVGAATPLDTSSPTKLVGGLTPQAIKPFVEGVTNTNLYTGNKIVPDSMKNLPPQDQIRPNTSPLAKGIGAATGISPLVVENAANTGLGGVGGQILGTNPVTQLQNRFTKASGGGIQNQQFSDIQKYQQAQAGATQKQQDAITKITTVLQDPNVDRQKKIALIGAISSNKTIFAQVKLALADKANGVTPADRAVRALSLQQRAAYIKNQLQPLSRDQKRALVIQYIKKGILNAAVVKEMTKTAQAAQGQSNP